MKRRILASLLLLAILFSGICPQTFAEDAAQPVIRVESVSADAGDTVQLDVLTDGEISFGNLSLEFGYNSNYLELTEVSMETLGDAQTITSRTLDVNPYVVIWFSGENVDCTGKIAALTFRVKNTAPTGDYEVSVDYYKGPADGYTGHDGTDVNFHVIGNQTTPLGLAYESGTVSVTNETAVRLSQSGETFSATLTGLEISGTLMAVRYDSGGKMLEVRLKEAAETVDFDFPKAETGDTVKCMWLTSGFLPVCDCGSCTVE